MKWILSIFFVLISSLIFAQQDSTKRWELQVAAGANIPINLHSSFEVSQKVGITTAISCHYYFSKQFYYGLNYNYSANQFKDIEFIEINPVLQCHSMLAILGGTYHHNNFFLQEDIGFGILAAYFPAYTLNYTSTDYLQYYSDASLTFASTLKLIFGNNISENTVIYFSAALLFAKPKWNIRYYGEAYNSYFYDDQIFEGNVIKSPYYLPLNLMFGLNIKL